MQVKKLKRYGWWVSVSESEAISIIISLAKQLESKSPNDGRREHPADCGPYFSIAVHSDEPVCSLCAKKLDEQED